MDGLLRDEAKPAFHLIEPRGVGRDMVHMVTGSFCQPDLDFGVFVGDIIVADQVHVQVGGDVPVDVSQKGQEFLMPVTPLTAAQDGAGRHVQGGKQGGGPVSDIVVRHAFV